MGRLVTGPYPGRCENDVDDPNGHQIGDRIVVEYSICYAERTMMRPLVGFGQTTSGLAWVDARFVAVRVLVIVTAQGSGHQ
jgi:hypothetical protein